MIINNFVIINNELFWSIIIIPSLYDNKSVMLSLELLFFEKRKTVSMAPMKVDLINIEYHDVYAPLCEMCPSWQAARSACWDSCGCARVTGASHGSVALTQPDATKLIMIPILPLWSIKKNTYTHRDVFKHIFGMVAILIWFEIWL